MSGEDFRAHLYRSLQGRGILDSLKSQLRNRLATELHKTVDSSALGSSLSKSPGKSKSMRTQVADSMVAEYLKYKGYEYSLSIFLPEAGVSIDKLFSKEDLLHYLGILPSSKIYRSLQSNTQTYSNFLDALLEAIISDQRVAITSPSPPQIHPEPLSEQQSSPSKKSVADRLEALDQSYARKAEEESTKCQLSLEDRLAGFQQDLEARYKQQLQTELSLYRGRELAKARQEEKALYQEKLAKQKEELHQIHQQRLEEVRRSEQNVLERYRRKEQELEAGIYSQRQTLLDELDALRVKEAGLKRQMELDRRTVALEKEHVKSMTDQLETKEKSLLKMKTHFELMAEEKVKKDMESQILSKNGEIAKRKLELKLGAESTSSYKQEKDELVAKLNKEKKLVEKLQSELQDVTWMQVTLQKQKDDSQEKLNQFGDYHQLKQKVAELQQQLSLSESKCAELEKEQEQTVKQLLSQPNLEQVSLQAEMDHLRKIHHKEILVLEYDNKQLGKQLASQTEHTLRLQKRLDDQLIQLRSAQREVHDLHSLLEHAHPHGAQISQRSHGKVKVGKSSCSPSKRTSRVAKPLSHHHQFQHHHSKPTIPQPPPSHVTSPFQDDTTWWAQGLATPNTGKEKNKSFFDTSGFFLAESKATIDRMEKEAEQLERTYLDLNSQMSTNHHSTMRQGISPLFPDPSPLLPDLKSPHQSCISARVTPPGILDSEHCDKRPLVYTQSSMVQQPPGYLLSGTEFQPRSTTPHTSGLVGSYQDVYPPVTSTMTGPIRTGQEKKKEVPNGEPNSSPASLYFPPPRTSIGSEPPVIAGGNTVPEEHDSSSARPTSSCIPVSSPPRTSVIAGANTVPEGHLTSSLMPVSSPPRTAIRSDPPVIIPGPNTVPELSLSVSIAVPTPPVVSTSTINASTTSFPSKPIISLDSWWKASESPTTLTQTPILSVVPVTVNREQDFTDQSRNEVDREVISQTVAETNRSVSHVEPTARLIQMETPPEESPVNPQPEMSSGMPSSVKSSSLSHNVEHSSEGGSSTEHPPENLGDSGHRSISEGTGIEERETKESEEDEIDPVMLKYMRLVKENRQQTTQVNETSLDHEMLPLSNSFGGFSNHGDDPFEDW